ncbi:MAG: hypothetical protein OES84_06555, partial [Kiritimatiellaceae bacterium]|nr:hypothetical protein [Kiritimatiellaceae bacterium]
MGGKMVVKIKMKNITKQGEIYYFRKGVPPELRNTVGKREIFQSLRTKDPLEAKKAAERLDRQYSAEFNRLKPAPKKPAKKKAPRLKVPDKPFDEDVADFRDLLMSSADASLPAIFEAETVDELKERAEH